MVRTRGGHRYRPRVRFNTPERDGAGTSRDADAHSPDQAAETPPTLAPAAISEEAQASELPSRRYQTRVGPRAPSLCASETTPEGPVFQAGPDIRPE